MPLRFASIMHDNLVIDILIMCSTSGHFRRQKDLQINIPFPKLEKNDNLFLQHTFILSAKYIYVAVPEYEASLEIFPLSLNYRRVALILSSTHMSEHPFVLSHSSFFR